MVRRIKAFGTKISRIQMYLIDRTEVTDMMRRYDVAQIAIDSPEN